MRKVHKRAYIAGGRVLGLKPGESAWEAVRSWARVWGPLSRPRWGAELRVWPVCDLGQVSQLL